MAIQRLGVKKLRQLARDTGLDLQMAWSWGDPSVVMLRTFTDEHYTYDRRSRELSADDGHSGCMSSCPGRTTYDPAEWERNGSYQAFGVVQQRA